MHFFVPLLFLWQTFFGGAVESFVVLRGESFGVEVMDDGFERRNGLMSRLYLAPDRGMIFVYDSEQPLTFWMKNTFLPLDIIFLDARRRVVNIQKNAVPCKIDSCSLYPSVVPAQFVVELNAGTADRIHLSVGDQMY